MSKIILTESQKKALRFLLKPWESTWWAGKPHGSWPEELNARSYDALMAKGLIKREHVPCTAFREIVKITPAGKRALSQPFGLARSPTAGDGE